MKPDLSYLLVPAPSWLAVFFGITTLVTLALLYRAVRAVSATGASRLLLIGSGWLLVLAVLAYADFFLQLRSVPPHFPVAIGPPFLLIAGLFSTSTGRGWLRQLPLSRLTSLHTVRVPVELTLYGLYVYHQVPQLMTFEGRNYDILAGLTAPVAAYYAFGQRPLPSGWLLAWNVAALGLVLNIVIHAVLSAPLPFQQLAFDQPNVGVLKLPYIWLPGIIVPTVLFCHAVAIFQLVTGMPTTQPYLNKSE